MYIAMNRFQVTPGREGVFEEHWRNRESYLDEVPGFTEFHLLRGATTEECTTYVSHSVWESEQTFEDWTESEAFHKAHSQAQAPNGTYLRPPRFEGFAVIM